VTQPDRTLRVAAIHFLNPAPLMWNFEHPPVAAELRRRYTVHYTAPAACAAELLRGSADLGLIPVAALTSELAVVPGCTIASLRQVRSILLLVRQSAAATLADVRSVAADAASRSSVAYAQVLFRHFLGIAPAFIQAVADPITMLGQNDAALIIGDPALLAREQRKQIEGALGPCLWIDLAEEWNARTGLPWVAAVWAARPGALIAAGVSAGEMMEDLTASRDAGLRHVDALVEEWTPRIGVPGSTIRTYLTENIYYHLDGACIESILLFRRLAAEVGALPPLPVLRFVEEER
jgi:chorismate dehydratase